MLDTASSLQLLFQLPDPPATPINLALQTLILFQRPIQFLFAAQLDYPPLA
jgi:hypothetical protein